MTRALRQFHPAVTMLYWLLSMGLSMTLLHPVCLGLSLLCAVVSATRMGGSRIIRPQLLLLIMLLTAVVNPLFNHRGVTTLCTLPGGNPLTLESIWYGLGLASMLASMTCWFLCLSAVETADRLTCLFGSLVPVLGLLLSVTLRFVPRLRRQAGQIHTARQHAAADSGGRAKLRRTGAELTALVGWTMEHAIHTADAMKARGYGLPGRSSFAVFRFTGRDAAALALMLLLAGVVAAGMAAGALAWDYVPVTGGVPTALTPVVTAAYGLLCALPLLHAGKEALRWRYLQSKI